MAWIILLLIVALPAAEILIFNAVADAIGTPLSAALLVGTSIVGLVLLRLNGLGMALRARLDLAKGEIPIGALFDGGCIAAGAMLLILPGFLTDALGLFLLLPIGRGLLRRALSGLFTVHTVQTGGPGPGPGPRGEPGVIDGDYEVVETDETKDPGCRPGPSMIATKPPEDPRSK